MFTILSTYRTGWITLAGCAGLVAASVVATALAADGRLETTLRAALTHLPHADAAAAACVADLATGRTVFEYHADQPIVPASTQKVFTMATSLATLGADFKFRTVCAVDGDRLVVVGDGDPGFGDPKLCEARGHTVTATFTRWAGELRTRGIAELPGGLVIDESIFDDAFVHPSWEEPDLPKWYAAPIGGLNINDNCVDITIWPADLPGAAVRWSVAPPTDLIQVVSTCTTGAGREPVLHHAPGTTEYRISGQCSKRWPFVAVSFHDPGLLFAGALKKAFAEAGVKLGDGLVRTRVRDAVGRLPESLRPIEVYETPIGDALSRTGKDSQNFFAEGLFKRSGFEWSRRLAGSSAVGSWETGRQATVTMLRSAGIDVAGMAVADGSGLSRDNRCTARQLTQVLVWAQRRPYGAMLRGNLAAAGTDGSLRRSMEDLAGRVEAKTGTMTGVRALAGYLTADNGTEFAFAIVFNGYPGSSTPYREIQHKFCQALASAGDGAGATNARIPDP